MICVEIVILITARIRRILKIMALNMYIRWKKEKMAKSALKGMSFYTTDHLSLCDCARPKFQTMKNSFC